MEYRTKDFVTSIYTNVIGKPPSKKILEYLIEKFELEIDYWKAHTRGEPYMGRMKLTLPSGEKVSIYSDKAIDAAAEVYKKKSGGKEPNQAEIMHVISSYMVGLLIKHMPEHVASARVK